MIFRAEMSAAERRQISHVCKLMYVCTQKSIIMAVSPLYHLGGQRSRTIWGPAIKLYQEKARPLDKQSLRERLENIIVLS